MTRTAKYFLLGTVGGTKLYNLGLVCASKKRQGLS